MTKNEMYIAYTRALRKLNVIKDLPQLTSRDSLIQYGVEEDETE